MGGDAAATLEGVPDVGGTRHDVPSQEDCAACHTYVRDAVIGFSAFELSNADEAAPDKSALRSFAEEGLFTHPPGRDFTVPGEGTVKQALGYLHGNCGFCHNARLTALIKRTMNLRLLDTDDTPERTGAYTTTFDVKMFHALFDDVDRAIVRGDPEKSQVYRRMTASGLLRMPPRGTKDVDSRGAEIIRAWIGSLPR